MSEVKATAFNAHGHNPPLHTYGSEVKATAKPKPKQTPKSKPKQTPKSKLKPNRSPKPNPNVTGSNCPNPTPIVQMMTKALVWGPGVCYGAKPSLNPSLSPSPRSSPSLSPSPSLRSRRRDYGCGMDASRITRQGHHSLSMHMAIPPPYITRQGLHRLSCLLWL